MVIVTNSRAEDPRGPADHDQAIAPQTSGSHRQSARKTSSTKPSPPPSKASRKRHATKPCNTTSLNGTNCTGSCNTWAFTPWMSRLNSCPLPSSIATLKLKVPESSEPCRGLPHQASCTTFLPELRVKAHIRMGIESSRNCNYSAPELVSPLEWAKRTLVPTSRLTTKTLGQSGGLIPTKRFFYRQNFRTFPCSTFRQS